MKFLTVVLWIALLLSGCTSSPGLAETPAYAYPPANTFAVQPTQLSAYPLPGNSATAETKEMQSGAVFLEGGDVSLSTDQPNKAFLHLFGSLPTPCHQLHSQISPPDAQHQIQVVLNSQVPVDMVCAQVITAFDDQIDLGEYASGTYQVWVNGTQIGGFVIP